MKNLVVGVFAAALTVSAASAQTYGRPAYPDYWNGGPPLPPLHSSTGHNTHTQGAYYGAQVYQGNPGYLVDHPQTQLSRARAYAYRFGYSAPVVVYQYRYRYRYD